MSSLRVGCAVVGGNHEASNHLWELYYGGWVAKNIYYLGHAGVVWFGGLRIGGVSGTYSETHYRWVQPPHIWHVRHSKFSHRLVESCKESY